MQTLPDGSRYNGRFDLPGDREAAAEAGISVEDNNAMIQWYATCDTEDQIEV